MSFLWIFLSFLTTIINTEVVKDESSDYGRRKRYEAQTAYG